MARQKNILVKRDNVVYTVSPGNFKKFVNAMNDNGGDAKLDDFGRSVGSLSIDMDANDIVGEAI